MGRVGIVVAYLWRRYQIAIILSALVALLIAAISLKGVLDRYSAEQRAERANRQAQLVRARKSEMYAQQRSAILESVRTLISKKDWDSASAEVSRWRDVGDKDLAALGETIDTEKTKILAAEVEKKNKVARAERIERERLDREAERALKKWRKTQGVHVGMTKQEVLESQWGRPQSINKTIYGSGVHEQWVYPGYQYLYFEDDKLTSIQTH